MAKAQYKVKYLLSFINELNEIIYYITFKLKNKVAAERLFDNVIENIEKRSESPEGYEIYKGKTNGNIKWYRIYVGKFTIFYTVNSNVMIIAHIIYSARNLDNLI